MPSGNPGGNPGGGGGNAGGFGMPMGNPNQSCGECLKAMWASIPFYNRCIIFISLPLGICIMLNLMIV